MVTLLAFVPPPPRLCSGLKAVAIHIPRKASWSLNQKGEEQTLFAKYCVCLFKPIWGVPQRLMQVFHICFI